MGHKALWVREFLQQYLKSTSTKMYYFVIYKTFYSEVFYSQKFTQFYNLPNYIEHVANKSSMTITTFSGKYFVQNMDMKRNGVFLVQEQYEADPEIRRKGQVASFQFKLNCCKLLHKVNLTNPTYLYLELTVKQNSLILRCIEVKFGIKFNKSCNCNAIDAHLCFSNE